MSTIKTDLMEVSRQAHLKNRRIVPPGISTEQPIEPRASGITLAELDFRE